MPALAAGAVLAACAALLTLDAPRGAAVAAAAPRWEVLGAIHDADSLRQLTEAAQQGSAEAQRVLGTALVGQGSAASVHDGQLWLQRATRAGNAKAALALGKLYFRGATGVPSDLPAARLVLKTAVDGGEAGAAYYLGLIARAGGSPTPDERVEAARWLELAASAGIADAQFLYGQMLLTGDGVAQNSQAARAWFEKAADQEQPEAHLQLLMARTRGELGFKPNEDQPGLQRQQMEAQHSLRHRPPPP